MNEKDDTARFTIRETDEAPDALYVADAENLRIEKLSTRITLVAVLIPCLLVIVLTIAYLDIKNRVINTQNTGSMGVQNLSKDLESRFSSLSLKQAKIEEQLSGLSKNLETATAAFQVNLKKSSAELKRKLDGKLNRSELNAQAQKSDTAIQELKQKAASLEAALAKFDKTLSEFDDELSNQILAMAEGIGKDHDRLEEIDKKIGQLDTNKMSKESLELTLGLERLALQEMVKERLREMEQRLATLGSQLETLNQRLETQSRETAPSPQSSSSSDAAPPSASQESPGSTGIVEQTIN